MLPPTPSACDIDFSDAGDGLSAKFEEPSKEFEIKRKILKIAARRTPFVRRIDRLEESLYWLRSAATLAYLVRWVIGF
jgi:hypothetical protein